MRYLTLIRHAKSSWDDLRLTDFERTLNKRGEKEAPRVGRALAHRFSRPDPFPLPDRLVSSPACRALSTAKIIAQEIGYPEERIVPESRIYEASALALLYLVREFDDSLNHVMMFGHNPGFEALAQMLNPQFEGDGEKFPTCGVHMMRLNSANWNDVAVECCQDAYFLCPKLLEE